MNGEEFIAPDGKATGIFIINEEEILENDEVVEEVKTESFEERLNSKSMIENMDSGIKIMGIGMAAVFAVLTILYIVVKIMGHFAKGKKANEEN